MERNKESNTPDGARIGNVGIVINSRQSIRIFFPEWASGWGEDEKGEFADYRMATDDLEKEDIVVLQGIAETDPALSADCNIHFRWDSAKGKWFISGVTQKIANKLADGIKGIEIINDNGTISVFAPDFRR